jgi:hypothetical protein
LSQGSFPTLSPIVSSRAAHSRAASAALNGRPAASRPSRYLCAAIAVSLRGHRGISSRHLIAVNHGGIPSRNLRNPPPLSPGLAPIMHPPRSGDGGPAPVSMVLRSVDVQSLARGYLGSTFLCWFVALRQEHRQKDSQSLADRKRATPIWRGRRETRAATGAFTAAESSPTPPEPGIEGYQAVKAPGDWCPCTPSAWSPFTARHPSRRLAVSHIQSLLRTQPRSPRIRCRPRAALRSAGAARAGYALVDVLSEGDGVFASVGGEGRVAPDLLLQVVLALPVPATPSPPHTAAVHAAAAAAAASVR